MTRAGISKPSSFNTALRPQKIAGYEEISVREHEAPQARHGARLLADSMIGHTQEPKSYETIVKLLKAALPPPVQLFRLGRQ
jgi:hypothetical protein